ncbi:MAG: hypothetical protein Q8M26_15275 [Pseudolabrys sp.]|nr:hypothetical protein [Pseudolabrys sp.]
MTGSAADRTLGSLVLDLLEWIAKEPRSYAQTMDVWRTSCPRLAVWEEAVDRGLVARLAQSEGGVRIVVTSAGLKFLAQHRRPLPVR